MVQDNAMIGSMQLCVLLLRLLTGMNPDSALEARIKADTMLVAPGAGAEGFVLNESIASLVQYRGYPEKVVRTEKPGDVFRDIFGQATAVPIAFDTVYYYEAKRAVVFLRNGVVSAVAGFERFRITYESVNLNNGIEYFIFHYGNDGMKVIPRGTDRMYLYDKRGIALVDDKNDNVIDMFIVFQPR